MPEAAPRPYDAHMLPPVPSADDWRKWDARRIEMDWIEREAIWILEHDGADAAARHVERWAGTYERLSKMVKPGSPEWVEQNRTPTGRR